MSECNPVSLERKGKIYISGPMTGIPEFNFPAFNAAADKLRAEGYAVENPAELGTITGFEWADYLRVDIALLVTCERIAMLSGWSQSKGACLEFAIATELGMEVVWLDDAEVGMFYGSVVIETSAESEDVSKLGILAHLPDAPFVPEADLLREFFGDDMVRSYCGGEA